MSMPIDFGDAAMDSREFDIFKVADQFVERRRQIHGIL